MQSRLKAAARCCPGGSTSPSRARRPGGPRGRASLPHAQRRSAGRISRGGRGWGSSCAGDPQHRGGHGPLGREGGTAVRPDLNPLRSAAGWWCSCSPSSCSIRQRSPLLAAGPHVSCGSSGSVLPCLARDLPLRQPRTVPVAHCLPLFPLSSRAVRSRSRREACGLRPPATSLPRPRSRPATPPLPAAGLGAPPGGGGAGGGGGGGGGERVL